MRGSEFLDKMGFIAPEYIEEAEEKPKRKNKQWIKWAAAAASICIFMGFAFFTGFYSEPEEPVSCEPGDGPSNLSINGISYYISSYLSVSDELPEGFVYAGETAVGGFENCPYYINPDVPEWVYVYHEMRTNGKVDNYGTLIATEPHNTYVRYVDERLRGKGIVCIKDAYYISMWSASLYDHPDVSWEFYEQIESAYGVRIEGKAPEGFEFIGKTEFSGYDTVPRGELSSNEGKFEIYINPGDPNVILVSTFWYTCTSEEKTETKHEGFDIYIKYNCPFA